MITAMTEVTRILDQIQQGDPHAADQLLPLVYDELRRVAAAQMAQEKPGQTLDATGLVHEAYLRLVAPADQPGRGSSTRCYICQRSRHHHRTSAAKDRHPVMGADRNQTKGGTPMKRLSWPVGVWGLGLILAAAGALNLHAGEGTKSDGGFVSLFNGKDLTGWVYPGKKGASMDGKTETPDGRIEVKDGAIVMKARDAKGRGGIKDLYTATSFDKDFVLKMQFKGGLKADSGVYIRGPQLQIRDFIRRNEQKQLQNFKNDDWNDLEIVVKGTKATFTVNGEQLKPSQMNVPAKGPIGLQAESGQFEYRRVRIKQMP